MFVTVYRPVQTCLFSSVLEIWPLSHYRVATRPWPTNVEAMAKRKTNYCKGKLHNSNLYEYTYIFLNIDSNNVISWKEGKRGNIAKQKIRKRWRENKYWWKRNTKNPWILFQLSFHLVWLPPIRGSRGVRGSQISWTRNRRLGQWV